MKKDDFTGLSGGQELTRLDTFSVERPEEDLLEFTVAADGRQETFWIRVPAHRAA